jgi:hypothetical protein
MIGTLTVVAGSMALGQVGHMQFVQPWVDDRPIATVAPYPANMADDAHRPGFNGRLWRSRPVTVAHGPYAVESGNPGAEYYGAFGEEDQLVFAKVGLLTIGISPWDRVEPRGLRELENARQFWLKERGYTGGVRTFVNDAYTVPANTVAIVGEDAPAAARPKGLPEPRGVIELAPDVPRRGNRIRVLGPTESVRPTAIVEGRMSWPHNAPMEVVERAEARQQTEVASAAGSRR